MYFKVSRLAFQVQSPYLTCFGYSRLVIIDIFEDWIPAQGGGQTKTTLSVVRILRE